MRLALYLVCIPLKTTELDSKRKTQETFKFVHLLFLSFWTAGTGSVHTKGRMEGQVVIKTPVILTMNSPQSPLPPLGAHSAGERGPPGL